MDEMSLGLWYIGRREEEEGEENILARNEVHLNVNCLYFYIYSISRAMNYTHITYVKKKERERHLPGY